MVDRELRDELAAHIEGFLTGDVSGPDLGGVFRRAARAAEAAGRPDPAISAVTLRLWQEFPDYYWRAGGYGPGSDRFLGHMGSEGLPAASWNGFVRAALFLRSDRAIEWPEDQWDPYDTPLADPPDALTVGLLALAGIAGLAAIMTLVCRQWVVGSALALIGAGLGFLWKRLDQASAARKPPPAGDPLAFPFLDQDDLTDELYRQGGPCVPFRTEGE